MAPSEGPEQGDGSFQPAGADNRGGGTGTPFTRLPPSLRSAIAAGPPPGGLDQIHHVVLLMQENRSFDHYFGTLPGVRGYADRSLLRTRAGGTVFEQPHPDGSTVLPFGVRAAAARQRQELQYIGQLAHGWEDGQGAWAGGWNDGWIAHKSPATMAGYDRTDIPLHFELAEAFTICDAYFSSVKSCTSPNRNYWVSGYTGFEPGSAARVVTNVAYDEEDSHAGYEWPTYPELLEAAGVSWKVYQEWDNFGDNNLEYFASFKAVMAKALASVDGGAFQNATRFYGSLSGRAASDQDVVLAALDRAVETLTPADRSLFERGIRRRRPGTLVGGIAADIAAGILPAVSYVVPSSVHSEHPDVSSPVQSARIIYDVLDVLASDPDVWAHTALLLTYDENDGFFDHVAPPVAPADVTDEYVGDRPIGLGVRVPMIVVSPWTVGGWVCSEVFDHTSNTQFLERWTGVGTDHISGWRRLVTGDLTSVFDFEGASAAPTPADPGRAPDFVERWAPRPPVDQALPAQEPGVRPARPLPYQPEASVALGTGVLRIVLANDGRRTASMAVYDWTGTTPRPVPVDVEREATLTLDVDGDGYDVTVSGPNRFIREFAGTSSGAANAITVRSCVSAADRVLTVTAGNDTDDGAVLTVAAGAYGSEVRTVPVPARGSAGIEWPTAAADGWYDVAITVAADPSFRRRLSGHIENGSPSITG